MNAKNLLLSMLASAAAIQAADSTVVADFDLLTNKNVIEGFWFFLDDKGSKGTSAVTSADTTGGQYTFSAASFAEGAQSPLGYSAKMAYTFGATRPSCGGTCTYSPEVTLGMNMVPTGETAKNITGATHITFWAKAVPAVKVSIIGISKDVTDYSWPRAEVSITSEWKKHTAYLSGAVTPVFKGTWGAMKDKNPTLNNMEGFSFALQKDTNPTVTTGVFQLDDLVIHGYKDPASAIRAAARPNLSRALRAADGKALKVSVPSAYRNAAGTVAALDLSGKTVASAAFAKGQESVSLDISGRANGTVFLRVFAGSL